MTDNGKQTKLVLKIETEDGKLRVVFGKDTSPASISYALRVAGLQLDDAILGLDINGSKDESVIKRV